MNTNWIEAVSELNTKGEAFVLVTLLGARGSTPRESGTKMVVSAAHTYGTIGGGHLEYKALAAAQKILADENANQHIEHYALGPTLGQCCGGRTSIMFERIPASRTNIMLFGAGHVGQALATILAALPCRVTWVDTRETQLPEQTAANITPLTSDTPAAEAATMPPGSYYLVMTHNHQLDFEICEAILKRNDFHYLGLIGSKTKWRRFQKRLQHKQYNPDTIAKIRCPIGSEHIPGKRPMEIAVSIAAEIINLYHRDQPPRPTQGVNWETLKPLLNEQTCQE